MQEKRNIMINTYKISLVAPNILAQRKLKVVALNKINA